MMRIKQSSSETEAYTELMTNIMTMEPKSPSRAVYHEKYRKFGLKTETKNVAKSRGRILHSSSIENNFCLPNKTIQSVDFTRSS